MPILPLPLGAFAAPAAQDNDMTTTFFSIRRVSDQAFFSSRTRTSEAIWRREAAFAATFDRADVDATFAALRKSGGQILEITTAPVWNAATKSYDVEVVDA